MIVGTFLQLMPSILFLVISNVHLMVKEENLSFLSFDVYFAFEDLVFLERLEQSLSFIIISLVEGNVTINFSYIIELMIKSFEVNKLWLEENLRELQLILWQKIMVFFAYSEFNATKNLFCNCPKYLLRGTYLVMAVM